MVDRPFDAFLGEFNIFSPFVLLLKCRRHQKRKNKFSPLKFIFMLRTFIENESTHITNYIIIRRPYWLRQSTMVYNVIITYLRLKNNNIVFFHLVTCQRIIDVTLFELLKFKILFEIVKVFLFI